MENKLRKINQPNTSAALYKGTNAATIALLKSNSEEALDVIASKVTNKVSDLLDCDTITTLIGHAGTERVKEYLERELVKLASMFNGNPALNLKDHQVSPIAEMLMENYKWESIEDFTLCFRRASFGMYGEIYRIDGAVIGQWMARYLDEKYDALEQRKAKEKHQEREQRANEAVDGSKYIQQMLDNLGVPKPEEKTNAKENGFQRHKLENGYIPPSEEQVKARLEKIRAHQERGLRDKYPKATDEQIKEMLSKLPL